MNGANLPRLLCGPILRRVDNESVTVWIVLKRELEDGAQTQVHLKVRKPGGAVILSGSVAPKTLDRLHIAAVRATGEPLIPGQKYEYDVLYGEASVLDAKVKAECNFEYMPATRKDVRIAHASCRKPDGEGPDALAALYREIKDGIVQRPHLLLLTGDQIYADGVAGPLLLMIMDARHSLLSTPDRDSDEILMPHERLDYLATAKISHSYKPDSHLTEFSEYLLMYLFVWSDALWGDDLPTMDDYDQYIMDHVETPADHVDSDGEAIGVLVNVYPRSTYTRWEAECSLLRQFRAGIPSVRSLLRSTPTLMIFDDHDVTDDWRINKKWINDVIGTALGKRIELNALLAYILAQASGNDAEYFNLVIDTVFRGNDVAEWRERDTNDAGLANLLAWGGKLQQSAIKFHYQIALPAIDLVVLDTRTRRGFTRGEYATLIADEFMADQIGTRPNDEKYRKPLVLVSAAPMFGHEATEIIQRMMIAEPGLSDPVARERADDALVYIPRGQLDPMLTYDAEAWSFDRIGRAKFVEALFARWQDSRNIIILSGDVHFAFSQTVHLLKPKKDRKLIQLTSSAVRNEERAADLLRTLRSDLLPNSDLDERLRTYEYTDGDLTYTLDPHLGTIYQKEPWYTRVTQLSELYGAPELLKSVLRKPGTYVHGEANCGLISFETESTVTHTLITRSMGINAHIKWSIPL